MALLAGLGFGVFFTALGQDGESAVFWPLIAGRLAACALMLAFALSTRRTAILARLITREHMARLQVIGVAVAILAIVLITI